MAELYTDTDPEMKTTSESQIDQPRGHKIIKQRIMTSKLKLYGLICSIFIVGGAQCQIVSEPLPPKLEMLSGSQADNQSVTMLTLKEAIFLALRNNPNVRSAELQRITDKFSLGVARNQYWPQLSLNAQALYQNGVHPNYNIIPSITLLTPFGTQISSNISQVVDTAATPSVIANATISATQPLLRGFGSSINKITLKNALDNEKINQLAYKKQVIDVVIAVINVYYQLVQMQNNLRIDKLSLKDAQELLDQTLLKIKVGKAAPADRIQQQVNIASRKLAMTSDQSNLMQGYQNLLNLLGLNPAAKLVVDQNIQPNASTVSNLQISIAIALQNNIPYQQALIGYNITLRNFFLAKDQQRWELDAVASMAQPMSKNSAAGLASHSLSLNLSIPIHDMPRQQQWVDARVGLIQAQSNIDQLRHLLIANVTNAYTNLHFCKQQILLSENYVRLAQQSLAITKIKYNYGKATTFELTALQDALTAAQLAYVAQLIQYQVSEEEFFQLLGTSLKKWHIQLDNEA